MAIIRVSSDRKNKRVLAFRAWHYGLKRMVRVRTCDFEDLDGDAELVMPDTDVSFRAKMHELVLLQDTNFCDRLGHDVFEGDIVYVSTQNIFGSWEDTVAEVVFDEETWGYNLDAVDGSGLPNSGNFEILRVVGNVYDGVDNKLLLDAYAEKNGHSGGKKTGRSDQ